MTSDKLPGRVTVKHKITLTNNFHNTSVNLIVDMEENDRGQLSGRLSESQVKRAKRELCCHECGCSGAVGHRGPQDNGMEFEPTFAWRTDRVDGAWVTFR